MDIYVLYRDMRTYGFKEDYYRQAAEKGVVFIRYEKEDQPDVTVAEEEGRSVLRVTVTEPTLGGSLMIDADRVALAVAAFPRLRTGPCPGSSRFRSTRTAFSWKLT